MVWKEAVEAQLWCQPGIRLEVRNPPIRIACDSAEIQTEHLPYTSVERYRCTDLLGGTA
jgi:hypothetical protein